MMNSTGTETITTMHFILIALLAIAAIAIIVVGVRLKGKRKAADDIIRDRVAEADAPAPPPVSPSPPPIADTPVIATPAPEPLQEEPIAAAAPMANPTTDAIAPARSSPADGPVTQIKGLGPKLADKLAELGITAIGQIASLDENEAQALDARLGAFTGRLQRDRWIEQARFLAAGDRAGFEGVFGKL